MLGHDRGWGCGLLLAILRLLSFILELLLASKAQHVLNQESPHRTTRKKKKELEKHIETADFPSPCKMAGSSQP